MFSALSQRNYRLFFMGQTVSLTGTWISNVAMSWLIYRLTGSAFLMGLITFINALPSLFLTPIAGVVIDKVNQYKMLLFIQLMLLLWAFALATLTLLGIIQVWHIIVLGLFSSCLFAFDMPLRQSFVVKLINKKELLSNAISLNSANFNMARLLGPAIAGVLIAEFSEGICFLLNSFSFVAVIVALLFIKLPNEEENSHPKKLNILKDFVDGFNYVKNSYIIRNVLICLSVSSFIGGTYSLIMPVFVNEFLSGNPKDLGLLMSASGVGALCGALFVASMTQDKKIFYLISSGCFIFGICFVGLSFLHTLIIDLFLMFGVGFGMVCSIVASNTIIQKMTDNDKRGRVMSFYTFTFIATVPIGNLFAGFAIEQIGLAQTLFLCGALMVGVSFYFRKKLSAKHNTALHAA